MEKATTKKIIGGFLIVLLVATIGAVIASADTDDSDGNEGWKFPFWGKRNMHIGIPFKSELTDEQIEELKELKENLEAEGKNPEEIREAIKEQLELYGIEFPTIEERLDNAIANTEQRLEVLEYIKGLIIENPDLTREEIRDLVQEEFDLDLPEGFGCGMRFRQGFRCGYYAGSRDFSNNGDSEI